MKKRKDGANENEDEHATWEKGLGSEARTHHERKRPMMLHSRSLVASTIRPHSGLEDVAKGCESA